MDLQLWSELLKSLSNAEQVSNSNEHITNSDDKEYYAVTLRDKVLEELSELAAHMIAIKQKEGRC